MCWMWKKGHIFGFFLSENRINLNLNLFNMPQFSHLGLSFWPSNSEAVEASQKSVCNSYFSLYLSQFLTIFQNSFSLWKLMKIAKTPCALAFTAIVIYQISSSTIKITLFIHFFIGPQALYVPRAGPTQAHSWLQSCQNRFAF